MLSLKKKLNAFMPGEGARGALQNVLTVEWSGHKTVLVEVPTAGSSRSNEVEMLGMGESERSGYGSGGGGYGRLSDDDEDERAFLTSSERASSGPGSGYIQPRQRQRSRQYSYGDKEEHEGAPPPLPPKPTQSQLIRNESQSRPPSTRINSNNPFKSAYEDEFDYLPRNLSNPHKSYESQLHSNPYDTKSTSRSSVSAIGAKQATAWTASAWANTPGLGQTSPTSSRGTRDSGTVTSEENPFHGE